MVDAEKMGADDRACDSLPDNVCLSGLWGAGDEDAGSHTRAARRHDVTRNFTNHTTAQFYRLAH